MNDILGGGGFDWLDGNIACDIQIETEPDDFETIWAKAQENEIDLVIQPAANRRKKVLIADMDSTMVQQECIDMLAVEAGIGEKVAEITARAMNGELDFVEAMTERVALVKGLDVGAIDRVLENRITYTPGGDVLLATMKVHGAYTALVSGGFTDFTAAVTAHLGFDEHRANDLKRANGILTGKVGEPILGAASKVDALNEITSKLGIGVEDAIAVGDGANDLGMLGLAGTGVALHAKPTVAAACSVRLNFADLTGLLYVQGFSADEFVRI